PKYQDLKRLFIEVLDKDYSKKDYIKQFTLRIPENLSKISRIIKIYETKVSNTPEILFKVLKEQRQNLKTAREKYGDYIPPNSWEVKNKRVDT
ncbi:phosphoenolpyruvate carboxykinase, partial [Patescibacteria group bacterium]|nr:phosphoenolpyruvate carboxykinase [Patescibacteria group bacterium]